MTKNYLKWPDVKNGVKNHEMKLHKKHELLRD